MNVVAVMPAVEPPAALFKFSTPKPSAFPRNSYLYAV